MITTWNIASATRPNKFEVFSALVRTSAGENGTLEVKALVVVEGPGCNNYGLMIEGPEAEAEKFIGALCMALQPGKYGRAEGDPSIQLGQFESRLPPK